MDELAGLSERGPRDALWGLGGSVKESAKRAIHCALLALAACGILTRIVYVTERINQMNEENQELTRL
jgi:hypothetical protein